MTIKKSKVFIQGVQVTSDHIGKWVVCSRHKKESRFTDPYGGIPGKIYEIDNGHVYLISPGKEEQNTWLTADDSPFLIWKDPALVDQQLSAIERTRKGFIRWKYEQFKDGIFRPVDDDEDNNQITFLFKTLDMDEFSRGCIRWEKLTPWWGIASRWSLTFTKSGLDLLDYSELIDELRTILGDCTEPQMAHALVTNGWHDVTQYFHAQLSVHRHYQIPDHLALHHPWLSDYLSGNQTQWK